MSKSRLPGLSRFFNWWRRFRRALPEYAEANLKEWRLWGTRRAEREVSTLGTPFNRQTSNPTPTESGAHHAGTAPPQPRPGMRASGKP